jgi:hypothetical protein
MLNREVLQAGMEVGACRGMVSSGPISSEWGLRFAWSRGSPNSVTSDDWLSQNACVFRAEPPDDNLGEVRFKLAGLDDQRVCGPSFWVCRGYFEQRLAANITVLLGGLCFEGEVVSF